MHQVYVEIIIDAIIEQFGVQKHFYQEYLHLNEPEWQAWKQGQKSLDGEAMQTIKNLFTDYEWMLTQKVLRQTILFPEKRNLAVVEYKRLKTLIAKQWLQSGVGVAEIVPIRENSDRETSHHINLKVTISYGEWGFDDIVTFRLPAVIQTQVEGSKVALLDWVNENLMDTYVGE
ncbi:hypothetical protein ACSFB8_05460 [Enterococcus faecalis]